MGKLNQITTKFATEVFSSFDDKSRIKDYPVAKEFFATARVRDKVKTVSFFGGSQGAVCINDFALKVAPRLNFDGSGSHRIDKSTVVRNKHNGTSAGDKKILKPLYRFDIQVVCRFIKQQHIRSEQ